MIKLNRQNKEAYTKSVTDALKAKDIKQFRKLFLALHTMDQVELFTAFDESDRKTVYHYLSPEEFAQIFQKLELAQQQKYTLELEEDYTVAVLNHMYADNVTDFLNELPHEQSETLLQKMDQAGVSEVKELMDYPEQTAGAIMTTEFISVGAKETVGEVMARLRKEAPDAETIYYLYVVEAQRQLVGVVSLRDLIIAPADELVEEVMSTNVVSVSVHDDQEDVAHVIKKYDFLAVPAVTPQGTLLGIVTVDDVIDVIDEETTEDIGEMSAARGAVDLDVSSIQAAKKRAPWIIILMFLGLITASVINEFEGILESVVILAAFIPLIMDSAGNTGTQSLAVVVRGLALGTIERKGIGPLFRRELVTGLILGVICAVVISIVIPIFYGNAVLGLVVGLSLLVALTAATVIGAVIPLVINKLNIDPAVASGPFITTVADIIGLFIYFTVATTFIHYLQ